MNASRVPNNNAKGLLYNNPFDKMLSYSTIIEKKQNH